MNEGLCAGVRALATLFEGTSCTTLRDSAVQKRVLLPDSPVHRYRIHKIELTVSYSEAKGGWNPKSVWLGDPGSLLSLYSDPIPAQYEPRVALLLLGVLSRC